MSNEGLRPSLLPNSRWNTTVNKAPLGADLVIPALALAFAAYFFFSIADLAWEAKANGVLVGTVLVALIGVQAVRTLLRVASGRGDLKLDPLIAPREALGRRIGLVLLTVVFIAAMPWLGLSLSLFLGLAAALYVTGVRSRPHLLWVSFGVAASAYLLFIATLNADLPHGPVENAIDALTALLRK